MTKTKIGFTLIEVLIVIAIIAMIIGVLLPNFNQLRQTSRDQARKAGVKALAEALELYKNNQTYPQYPTTEYLEGILDSGGSWEVGEVTYLNNVPVDPLFDTDPDEFYYRYFRNTTDSLRYYVGVCLENANDPDGKPTPDGAVFSDNECDSNLWYYKTEP
jgi:prepilin-type N-terminal cleavage/methylation domain-containing protein